MSESTKCKVDVILETLLNDFKIDYTSKIKQFEEAYDNQIHKGEKDVIVVFNDNNYPDVRLIEEGYYEELCDDEDDKANAEFNIYGYYLVVKNGKEYDFSAGTINHANLIIAELLKFSGIDYTPKLFKIAKNYDNYLMRGHWYNTVEFEDENFPNIRLIQEDEYDQHMDDDEKPDYDLFVDGYYVIINQN